jgi:cysteine synthase
MTTLDAPAPTLTTAQIFERIGLGLGMVDASAYDHAVERFAANNIVLPTFTQLREPWKNPVDVSGVHRMAPDARNLHRVHWYNQLEGDAPGVNELADHVVLPSSLTGVDCPIIVLFGDRFPMITAHKVQAAYSCLVPRLITGRFDPTHHRAIWPSTGNYARGGVAISRIMGCRGVAVLPAGMSQERFDWLDEWITEPSDVIRTVGTESNVKEIYDACNELEKDPTNVILNQFNEFGNYLGHITMTAPAFGRVFDRYADTHPSARLAAFVSATGSAGTIGAGDWLKHTYGTKIVAVEALECPTMLENGYGEHNIQGIGDKHIPLIHNVMNTDVVVGISDRATDELDVVFNTEAGQRYVAARYGASPELIAHLTHFGFSAICNTLAAIKTAKELGYGPDDVIMTVATDGSDLYPSERRKTMATKYPGGFTEVDAAAACAEHLDGASTDHLIECTALDRRRIFNLGYFTWVEQQHLDFDLFEARRDQALWQSMWSLVDEWDERIVEFNGRVAAQRP